jgi:hypothetical protein
MKTLKICLVILCLLHARAVGTPRFSGASFFMAIIKLNSPKYGVKEVLIDDEDVELTSKFKWQLRKDTHGFYCHANGKCINKKREHVILIHRLIMNAPKDKKVDHKNGNGLDNRKCNLRLCTNSENSRNKRQSKQNKLGVRNIYVTTSGKYAVRLSVKTKVRRRVGVFSTLPEAIQCYNEMAKKYYGEFAVLI